MEFLEVPSPLDVTEAWWVEIAKKSKNAVVFIDDNFSESLHWCGGVSKLWNAGCLNIKSFSSFEKCEATDDRAIFLITSAISDTPMQILKDIISISNLHHVTVISAVDKYVQCYIQTQDSKMDENVVIAEIERKILSWFKNNNPVVEIFYFPVLLLSVAEDVFLMPKFREMYPIMESEISNISDFITKSGKNAGKKMYLGELEFDNISFKFRQEIKQLIGVFHNIFQVMNVREEIFSIGPTSSIIASELDSFMAAKLRRRTATGKISLVLIDRTLDLAGPVVRNSSSLYGKIITSLDNLPNHNIDHAINLSSLSPLHQSCDWTLIPGCFSHPEIECKQFMNEAIKGNSENAIQLLTQIIKNYVEGLGHKKNEDLLENIKILFNTKTFLEDHFGIIQQGLGVIASQKESNKEHQNRLENCRRSMLQAVTDHSTEPMAEMLKLLSNRHEMGFSLEDVLSIMLYMVSVGGERLVEDSMKYKFVNSVSLAILEEKDTISPALLEIVEGEVDDLSALKLANKFWNSFLDIATTRSHLKDYRSISSTMSEAEPVVYENFIVRLIKDCILKGSVNDLDYKSSGFKNMIKSGFSLFVNVSKPMPKEASMMILYVVGGITSDEVKEISEFLQDVKPNLRVVIGSSHFTKPQDSLVHMVRDNPLMKCN